LRRGDSGGEERIKEKTCDEKAKVTWMSDMED